MFGDYNPYHNEMQNADDEMGNDVMNADMNAGNARGSNYPMVNADIAIGAFVAGEYADAIHEPHSFADMFINIFDRNIDYMIDSILDDSRDDLVDQFEFIIPAKYLASEFEDELYDELYAILSSSDMHSALKRAYESAIEYIEKWKGLKLISVTD